MVDVPARPGLAAQAGLPPRAGRKILKAAFMRDNKTLLLKLVASCACVAGFQMEEFE